jgi:predicted membrane protein
LSPEESPFVMLIHDPSAFLVLVASFTFALFNVLKFFIWFGLLCFKRIKKQKKQTLKTKEIKKQKEKVKNEETQKVEEEKIEKKTETKEEEDSWSEYSNESNSDEEKVCPCHLE